MPRRRTQSSGKPTAGDVPSGNSLKTGIITAFTDDPAKENRIQVKLSDAATEYPGDWARIASLNTGSDRSISFQPEIGDEVIVGFINNNPQEAVILGLLHKNTNSPPSEVEEIKGYTSSEGLILHFNEEDKSIHIKTPGGNKIVLSDENQGILLEDQNGNKIAMGPDGITIRSVIDLKLKSSGDLEISGMNVSINSDAMMTVSGGAGAKVSSSGVTEIQGSLVKIN